METFQTGIRNAADAASDYIRKVYGWMTAGLLITAVTAWYVARTPALYQAILGNTAIMIVLIIAQLGAVIALSFAVQKMSGSIATGIFVLYALLSGATISSIFIVYPIGAISNAFFTAAGMFLIMSIYGTVTKRDLTSWGSFLMMGLFGIIIAMIVNIFLKSNAMSFVISCIGVIVFTGLTAYDTQKLRAMGAEMDPYDGNNVRRWVIIGALTLYLDFINLFLMLLRLFGGGGKSE